MNHIVASPCGHESEISGSLEFLKGLIMRGG